MQKEQDGSEIRSVELERLVVEGLAPCEYVGKGLHVGVSVDGVPPVAAVLQDRPFHLEVDVPDGSSFREASLTSDRSFVPGPIKCFKR